MTRSWREMSTGEVEAAVERIHDRQLAAYEAEQDRAQDSGSGYARECPWCGIPGCRECGA
jgi:hypothetical protein